MLISEIYRVLDCHSVPFNLDMPPCKVDILLGPGSTLVGCHS